MSETEIKLFAGLSSTEIIFQDFPIWKFYKEKFQNFSGGLGTLVLLHKKSEIGNWH